MKKIGIILVVSLLYSLSVLGQKMEYISLNINDYNFNDFIDLIESKTSKRIYYSDSLGIFKRISINSDSIPIIEALQIALDGTNLFVSPWHNSYVILDEPLPLANNVFNNQNKQLAMEETSLLTDSEKRYLEGRRANVVKTIVVGNKNSKTIGKARVIGRITDGETGQSLIGATLFIEDTKTGTSSDMNGNFKINLSPGFHNVEFSSLGYKTKKYQLNVYSDDKIDIQLESSSFALEEAVIKGDKQFDVRYKDPGLEKLTAKTIRSLPVMVGERDLIKVSETLPGIVSVGEGSSGLSVRGGQSDQNAFYINNIPIYNTSHVFGFFPAFNSDIIKDFEIYKGHVPVNYGGRLSSVFNISAKQGNKDEFGFHGGVNPISAYATLEGPIKNGKNSVLLSGRSLYSDWILSKIEDPTISKSSANFNDFSFGLNFDFEKTLISTFAYISNDQFDLSDINKYCYSNKGASISVQHIFNNTLNVDFSLIGSQYSFETEDMQEPSLAYKHNYSIEHYEFRADLNHQVGSNYLKYGFSGIYYQLDRGLVSPLNSESLRQNIDHGNEQGFEGAIYLSDSYEITPRLTVNAGIRYSVFAPMGEAEVYLYDENRPLVEEFINDTLKYKRNELIKFYHTPEFRLSLNFKTDDQGSIKIAFNQMSQNLSMLNNTITVAPNTQWKLADYHIKPSKSNQISLGVFRDIPSKKLEASIELFYKKTRNLTEFKDGADFINNPIIENEVLQGKQESYGAEFYLKKTSGKLNGWLSYTYSRSFVQVDGPNDWEDINFGKKYPSNYDIPNVFNAVLNYEVSRRITLSTVITYKDGRPATYPVSVYYIDEVPIINYYERNQYRIPNYFRTDVSLSLEGSLKKNKLFHSSWMLSIYNVTGRENAYSVYFKSEEDEIKAYKYSVIGTPFFTITWLFKFGNYASK